MNLCYPDLWKKDRNRAPRIAAGVGGKGSRKHGKGVPEPGAADSVGGYPGDLHAHGADQTDTFAGGLGIRHDLFEENSLYQCFARIIDRYKSNNVYVLVMELTSNLRKYQRREYYRFSCALDMCARNLEEEEIQALEKNSPYELQPGLPLKHSVIVDISGGGLRFVSTQRYEPGSLILCSYHLVKDGEQKSTRW